MYRYVIGVMTSTALLLLLPASRTSAWTRATNVCGGPVSWHPSVFQNIPYRRLACSPNGYPGLPGSTDSSGSSEAESTAALSNATWMWVREGTSNANIYLETSICGTGPEDGGWFDRSDTTNEVWFESNAIVTTLAGGPAIGLTGNVYGACAWPGLHTNILGFDIVHSTNYGFSVVDQDSISDCFKRLSDLQGAASLEHHMLHELGHAYGLNHHESAISVMNVTGRGHHTCHVAQGFSDFPYGDDMGGLMEYNEISGNPRFNTAGTPWVRIGGDSEVDIQAYGVVPGDAVLRSVQFTAISSYSDTYSASFRFVVADSAVFNWTTGGWSFPNQVWASATQSLALTPQGSKRNIKILYIPGTVSYQPGHQYRVWVQIFGAPSETDHGDDVFPTGITVHRL